MLSHYQISLKDDHFFLARNWTSLFKGLRVADFKMIKEVFLADITAEVLMNDIPDKLIMNWDHTGLPLVPTGQWTMHHAGDKIVPISNVDDKCCQHGW